MILEILVLILSFITAYLWFRNKMWQVKFDQKVREWIDKYEKATRQDAISKSARVLSGKSLEKLIPFLDRFPYDPHDVRWLGDPIDLVIFDGKSEDNLRQVVFCEVKSGDSKLTKTQRDVKDAVENKKVKWAEFRV
jgi:predicted Holliday junction resolvase-like endonuclease